MPVKSYMTGAESFAAPRTPQAAPYSPFLPYGGTTDQSALRPAGSDAGFGLPFGGAFKGGELPLPSSPPAFSAANMFGGGMPAQPATQRPTSGSFGEAFMPFLMQHWMQNYAPEGRRAMNPFANVSASPFARAIQSRLASHYANRPNMQTAGGLQPVNALANSPISNFLAPR